MYTVEKAGRSGSAREWVDTGHRTFSTKEQGKGRPDPHGIELGVQCAVEPSIPCASGTICAVLDHLLCVEVTPGSQGRSDSVYDAEVAAFEVREQGYELGMESKRTVQIDDALLITGSSQRQSSTLTVVVGVVIGDDHVKSI